MMLLQLLTNINEYRGTVAGYQASLGNDTATEEQKAKAGLVTLRKVKAKGLEYGEYTNGMDYVATFKDVDKFGKLSFLTSDEGKDYYAAADAFLPSSLDVTKQRYEAQRLKNIAEDNNSLTHQGRSSILGNIWLFFKSFINIAYYFVKLVFSIFTAMLRLFVSPKISEADTTALSTYSANRSKDVEAIVGNTMKSERAKGMMAAVMFGLSQQAKEAVSSCDAYVQQAAGALTPHNKKLTDVNIEIILDSINHARGLNNSEDVNEREAAICYDMIHNLRCDTNPVSDKGAVYRYVCNLSGYDDSTNKLFAPSNYPRGNDDQAAVAGVAPHLKIILDATNEINAAAKSFSASSATTATSLDISSPDIASDDGKMKEASKKLSDYCRKMDEHYNTYRTEEAKATVKIAKAMEDLSKIAGCTIFGDQMTDADLRAKAVSRYVHATSASAVDAHVANIASARSLFDQYGAEVKAADEQMAVFQNMYKYSNYEGGEAHRVVERLSKASDASALPATLKGYEGVVKDCKDKKDAVLKFDVAKVVSEANAIIASGKTKAEIKQELDKMKQSEHVQTFMGCEDASVLQPTSKAS